MTLPRTVAERLRIEDPQEQRHVDRALVADLFDEAHYLSTLPLLKNVSDPLGHFLDRGWRNLRSPNPDFDVWWYWSDHMDPADDSLNPLVHYALEGRAAGLSTRPGPVAMGPGIMLPTDRPVRRACLLAGFDAEGVVDDAFMMLLHELARHADVYCLFDNYLPPEELQKVRDVAVQAWAIRHGAYDFGSYGKLAAELVGWDTLADYDEVLFVNDSCYLLRPLDEVLEQMAAEPCDWWGLQATKGLAMTKDSPVSQLTEPVGLDRLRDELLDVFEQDDLYDFHLGSYFLAFRQPVLRDEAFRALMESVAPQDSKLLVIRKYEIGLTRLLIGRGHRFSTFVPALWPFHPVFTESAFTLIEQERFPLLKRLFVYRNHYDVPGMSGWKERLTAIVPDAPVDVFEENLLRTSPADHLYRSFAIRADDRGEVLVPQPMKARRFAAAEDAAERDRDLWVFGVDPYTHLLPDNSRAILERLADHPDITPVVLTRSRPVHVAGRSVRTFPALSPEGQDELLRAGAVLLRDKPHTTFGLRPSVDHHVLLAVRGGLMLTREGRTAHQPTAVPEVAPSVKGAVKPLHEPTPPLVSAVLAASAVDHAAAVAAQGTLRFGDGWRTGLPGHDFLLAAELPPDLAAQEQRLREALDGRRLVLLATVRRGSTTAVQPYPYSAAEVDALAGVARDAGAVIGIREPIDDLERFASRAFAGQALDVSAVRYPSLPAVLRVADVLVTDYSGVALDFTLTGRPAVSFAPDLDAAASTLLFDLEHLFPGPVCRDVAGLTAAIGAALQDPEPSRQYLRVRRLLVDRLDDQNSARAVDRLREEVANR